MDQQLHASLISNANSQGILGPLPPVPGLCPAKVQICTCQKSETGAVGQELLAPREPVLPIPACVPSELPSPLMPSVLTILPMAPVSLPISPISSVLSIPAMPRPVHPFHAVCTVHPSDAPLTAHSSHVLCTAHPSSSLWAAHPSQCPCAAHPCHALCPPAVDAVPPPHCHEVQDGTPQLVLLGHEVVIEYGGSAWVRQQVAVALVQVVGGERPVVQR